MKTLIFINQYYPPDAAPTGVMLESVAEELAGQGNRVTIICSKQGGYARSDDSSVERRSRVRVMRVGGSAFGRESFIGKIADYVSFYAAVAWTLATMPRGSNKRDRGNQPERIVAMTTPPYLSILARFFSKIRGADHAHWVMDLYPDVMVAHGMLEEGGAGYKVLMALTRLGFGGGRCATVLSLGADMSRRVSVYLEKNLDSPWVPLWSGSEMSLPDEGEVSHLRSERGWQGGDLVLMYSGNMGLGHLFSDVLELSKSNFPNLKIVFYGGGRRRAEIEQFMKSNPETGLELHDYVDMGNLKKHLASADVHLVSLRPEWDGAMVPSKLQGIFAVARPVIFIGSGTSSIGKWVSDSGGGWVVEPGDTEALRLALEEATNKAECGRRGEAAYRYSLEYFDCKKNARLCARWLSR